MKHLFKSLLLIAICALPAVVMAQPETCRVRHDGSQPDIKDFARAYCHQCDEGSFERLALVSLAKGTHSHGPVECVVDVRNGYVKYSSRRGGEKETLEMCYWNCDNRHEKLVAVNRISGGMGFDESFIYFYRYSTRTGEMTLIDPPFDREPEPIDMVNKRKASKRIINTVRTAENEDANKFQPCFQLPRSGKNITFRMADRNAIPKNMQREGVLIWNGRDFYIGR